MNHEIEPRYYKKMKIVCISDTHNQHNEINIPEGDILIHAGDFTTLGKFDEITSFNSWLGELPHKHKIIIAGNHDRLFESDPNLAKSLITNAIYLQDSGIEIEGLNIWGTPVSPRFYDWAFNKDRGEEIKKYWDLIPKNTDILITHCPPYNILDMTYSGEYVGCYDLAKKIKVIKPKICIFGHIHQSYGMIKKDGIIYINACSLDEQYKPKHEPIVIEL